MCGIAAILSPDGERADPELMARMLQRLVHRGPDDEGSIQLGPLTLGMRRLSILDPTPRGHQPMASTDGRFTIVHNGEIYNFLELADELRAGGHAFRTESDTEVILAAYATWGVDFLSRLNGIWAFAIWDSAEESLLLSRDRFGVKPLYLAESGGTLAVASEIKALRTLPWVSPNPDSGAIRDYLLDGSVDRGTKTFFADIERFPAAHGLLVTREGRRWVRYWAPPGFSTDASMRAAPSDGELVEDFRSRLVDAVRLQLRSDVPIGSCLSGGLDSSSIVTLAASLRSGEREGATGTHRERDEFPQLAFFAEFREFGIDERPFVDAVVAATGTELRTTSPDGDRFLEALDGVLDAQDEPFGSLSIVAQYEVMRIARAAGVKVLLDGQGADELLGGYLHYPAIRLAGALRSGSPTQMLDAARTLVSAGGPYPSTLIRALLGSRRTPERLRRGTMPRDWFGPALHGLGAPEAGHLPAPATLLGAKLWRDIASDNLPGLLRYEDRNSMAFGIEARVPFLDHRLVEAILLLPDRLRVAGPGKRKVALVRAMRGTVPDRILARTDKVAFQPPQDRWLRETNARWRALANGSVSEQNGFLRAGTLLKALDAFFGGRIAGNVLWHALNLELWLRGPGAS
jgi:asparagine synthase (glutamine-hydrolysing)